MILADIAKVLRDSDVPVIINASLDILERTGVQVENDQLLEMLGDNGAIIDKYGKRARFPKPMTEQMLASSKRMPRESIRPSFSAFASVYQGLFLDPRDGEYKEWNRERILIYAALARALPNVESIYMLGYPVAGSDVSRQPLLEKWFCWKYGIDAGGAIWTTGLCPRIYEMWRIYADWRKRDIGSVFNGAVYLISPLRFAKEEAAQFVYFYNKGLRVNVGWMGALGATVPVTPDGALALQFAEAIFVNLLNRVCFHDQTLNFHCSLSVMDMRTGCFQFGRPEQVALNIAGAQIAQYLGAPYRGHEGLTGAKLPGYESAAQKVYSALFGAMAYGSGCIEAGLLSVDEVFSPIQMILDDEMTGTIKKVLADIPVSGETLAVGVVDGVSPGGTFLDHEHTYAHFKNSLWFPSLWTGESFGVWRRGGKKNEIDRALEKYESLASKEIAPEMPDDVEQELLKVIGY